MIVEVGSGEYDFELEQIGRVDFPDTSGK